MRVFLALVCLCLLAGCPTDELPPETVNNPTCLVTCDPGAQRCAGDRIEACAVGSVGCLAWISGVDCAAQQGRCADPSATCEPLPQTCLDGQKSGDETDTDCGGSCGVCSVGGACTQDADCEFGCGDQQVCAPKVVADTCLDGQKSGDETDVDCGGSCAACALDAACAQDRDCQSASCGDQGTCAEMPQACAETAQRCEGGDVQTCSQGAWSTTQTCVQGCSQDACSAAVTCTPGAQRCYDDAIVQRCNDTGTAWLYDALCEGGCQGGLCAGACVADETRCNQDTLETCGADNATWSSTQACALGCQRGTCVEDTYDNKGLQETLSGVHVYQGCWSVSLAGSVTVPAGEHLEVRAKCVQVSDSSQLTLEPGATLLLHARETFEMAGGLTGGDQAILSSYQSMTMSGDVASAQLELRADQLTLTGTTENAAVAVALHGDDFDLQGTHTGVVSVMPPLALASATYPEGYTWNLADEIVDISWDKPFPGAQGYYVSVNQGPPGPDLGEFVSQESIALPAELFRHGSNQIHVVAVNAKSEVGTHAKTFEVRLNERTPMLSSTSHPDPSSWSDKDDVFMSWEPPAGLPDGSWVGYTYIWDRFANTRPTNGTGTFRTEPSVLLQDQAQGMWAFHIAGVDRLGRVTRDAAHRRVKVGPEPMYANIAGTLTDAISGDPVRAASVTLDGGMLRAISVESGDYTFSGRVPVLAGAYTLRVSARGYVPQEATVMVQAGGVEVRDFMLTPGDNAISYQLGAEIELLDRSPGNAMITMGPADTFAWTTATSPETLGITTFGGDTRLNKTLVEEYYNNGARTDLGWTGDRFWSIDYYKCDDDGSLRYGHGWSCLSLETYDVQGTKLDGPLRWRNSGHTGAPSSAFDGTNIGTIFGSYSAIYFRGVSTAADFTNAGSPTDNTSIAAGYGDTRQSIRTHALWDGSNYAVVFSIENSGTSGSSVHFMRVGANGAVIDAAVPIDTVYPSAPLGLAFDGTNYHLTYTKRDGNFNQAYLVSIPQNTLTPKMPMRIGDPRPQNNRATPSILFDQRYLVLAYDNTFEARDPDTLQVVSSTSIPGANTPKVSFNPDTFQGVLLYGRNGKTWAREIRFD